jgi:hypothetical protein
MPLVQLARQKALEEKLSGLKKKGSDGVTLRVAKAFNDNPMDLDKDHVDDEDEPAPNPINQAHNNETRKARQDP